MCDTSYFGGLKPEVWQQIHRILAKYPEVQQALLYGSRAKGNYHSGSDIDLCLIAPAMAYSVFTRLATELDDLLLPYMLDLVLHHHIDSAELKAHIARMGQVAYEKVEE